VLTANLHADHLLRFAVESPHEKMALCSGRPPRKDRQHGRGVWQAGLAAAHTYTTAGPTSTFMGYTVNHCLLFEKDE
jgi:hypothetical protein